MDKCPRRTLLGGIGATVAASATGILSTTGGAESLSQNPIPEVVDGDADATAVEFETLFEYLPASVDGDSPVLIAVDVPSMLEAEEPHAGEPQPIAGDLEIPLTSLSRAVVVETREDYSNPITVLSGDVEIDAVADERESDDGTTYDYYESESHVAAAVDDVVIVSESADLLDDALAAAAGDADRLVTDESIYADAMAAFPDADQRFVIPEDEFRLSGTDVDGDDVRFVVTGRTVVDPDTIEMHYGIGFTDADLVTEDVVQALEDDVGLAGTGTSEPTVETDDALVTISFERDLEAERKAREIESPSLRTPHRIDHDAEYVELEVYRGDPTPVEELSLELNGEEYDPDVWADGQETIEEGDTIRISVDEIEPNLRVTFTHDHEYGTYSSTTTINSYFRFDATSDVDAGTVTLEYADEFPLDGDELYVATYPDRGGYGDDPLESTQPWAGEEVTAGDETTVHGVEPGQTVIVGWSSDDRTDSIYHHYVRPPGFATFDYDYQSGELTATLEFRSDESRPASEYRLLLDDVAAETQWADDWDTVESGASITLDDVDVGTRATVVWGENDAQIGSTTAQPSVQLELYEEDDGYTLEHVDGDSLPVADLELEVWSDEGPEEFSLQSVVGDSETFEEGDSVSLEFDEIRHVLLRYDDYTVGYAWIRDR